MHRPPSPSWQGKLLSSVVSLLFVALVLAQASTATTWLVRPDQSGDAPTIQAAVDLAAPGDTVILADGVFTGAGNKDIQIYGKELVVRSLSGDPAACTIDCEAGAPVFHRAFVIDSVGGVSVPGSGSVAIRGITITRAAGHYGGAVRCERSCLEVVDCVFNDNFATYGGGMFLNDSCTVTVTRCVFSNNEAVGDGAISYYGAELAVSDCLFIDNTGGSDGPGAVWGRDGTLSFENCAFIGNRAKWSGGAILLNPNLDTTILNCTFVGNASLLSDGSALAIDGTNTIIERSIIAYNGPGAAISGCGDSLLVACTDLYGNPDGDWVEWMTCLADADTLNGNFTLDPLFCDTLGGTYSLASSSPCLPPGNTCGVLVGAYELGCDVPTSVGGREPHSRQPTGVRVTPNPFNPRTLVSYVLPYRAFTTLRIYDVHGRKIRTLVSSVLPAGEHEVVWEGRTDFGVAAASGVYFVRLESGGAMWSAKLMLLK